MEPEEANGILGSPPPIPPPQPVGVYGWRKRCLYACVLMLMVAVVMNLALTVWILRVLHFSMDGMGKLKIAPKGFRLEGEAEFLKPVYVDEIQSEAGTPLHVLSDAGIHLSSKDKNDKVKSSLVIGDDRVQAKCHRFQVVDLHDNPMFLVQEDKIYLGQKDVSYPGKIRFSGSISTSTVYSPDGKSLELRSNSSKVHVTGMGGVSVKADAGNVSLKANQDIFLTSDSGAIHLRSPNLILKNVPAFDPFDTSTSPGSSFSPPPGPPPIVYQLCVCESGRVFLSLPGGDCMATADICG